MSSLQQFCDMWNYSTHKLDEASLDSLQFYLDLSRESFIKQFTKQSKRTHIGLSEIGKPAVETAVKHLINSGAAIDFIEEELEEESSLKMSWILHIGDYFEALILTLLHEYGFEIDCLQEEVNFNGILGHIDAVYNNNRVLEIKTMSGPYFEKFIKEQNDDRGYLTQLHLYCYCKGTTKGSWLCLNKWTNQLVEIELDYDEIYIERAESIIKALPLIKKFRDIKDYFMPPEPEPEVIRNKATGRFLVPESMRYSNLRYTFYNTKDGRHVDDF